MGMAGTTTKMNCIYNVAGETLELAMKMEATVEGRSEVVKCWVKDDSAYGEFSGESGKMIEEMVGTNKIKEAVDGEMLSDLIESLDTLTLEYCVERGKELDLTLPEIGLKVDVQDGVTRYEISNEDADGVKIYFLFEEGVLTSVQMEMASSSYMGATSVKVVIEAFDGEIEFPDFGGFKDVTALMG